MFIRAWVYCIFDLGEEEDSLTKGISYFVSISIMIVIVISKKSK